MGWGHKAIEIRAVETGHLDGVFMHKKAQKLKFLCERNDKVQFCFSCEAYFVNTCEWIAKTLCYVWYLCSYTLCPIYNNVNVQIHLNTTYFIWNIYHQILLCI